MPFGRRQQTAEGLVLFPALGLGRRALPLRLAALQGAQPTFGSRLSINFRLDGSSTEVFNNLYEYFRKNADRRKRMARLTINGTAHDIDIDANTPLLWVLRDTIGLTGTKYGCGIAQCGACTVHVDGIAMRSCSVPLSAVAGRQITTIEGLAQNGALHKVQKAWLDHDVPQCGYCQCGMIMAVAALLKDKPKPTDADIDANVTNICRCGTFQQVRAAIHAAAASA
jgi:isoquinoline 1-oxidoreductase subunit alpha